MTAAKWDGRGQVGEITQRKWGNEQSKLESGKGRGVKANAHELGQYVLRVDEQFDSCHLLIFHWVPSISLCLLLSFLSFSYNSPLMIKDYYPALGPSWEAIWTFSKKIRSTRCSTTWRDKTHNFLSIWTVAMSLPSHTGKSCLDRDNAQCISAAGLRTLV